MDTLRDEKCWGRIRQGAWNRRRGKDRSIVQREIFFHLDGFFFKHAILKHISFVRWFSSSGILIKREWRAKGKNARIPRLIDITATTQDWAHTQVRARRKRSGNDRGSFVAIFNEFSNSSYLYNKLSPFDPNQSIKRNLVFFYRSRNIYLSFDLIDWNRFLTLPFSR